MMNERDMMVGVAWYTGEAEEENGEVDGMIYSTL